MRSDRQTIRNHASQMGAETYRITKSGQVDYYGRMPNSIEKGWYFQAFNAADHAATIRVEDEMIAEGKARRS